MRLFDRAFDKMDHSGESRRARELKPLKKRIAAFEKNYKKLDTNFKSVAADKFHPLHISDFDMLAAALLDPRNISNKAVKSKSDRHGPVSHPDILDSVLFENGIPSVARNTTSNMIAYMLRRRYLASRPLSARPAKDVGDDEEELIRQALRNCPTFSKIDRLVTRVAKDQRGCDMLLRVSDELYESLVGAPEAEPLQSLSLLNNLEINLNRYNLDLPTKFHELAIWISLKCQAIVTAEHHFKRRLELGPYDHGLITSILDKLLQTSLASSPIVSYDFQLDSSDRLTAVFSLLTGYVPGENQLAVSLRSLVDRERPDGFRLYIQCLARLGAFRTIWHEWHNTSPPLSSVGAGVRQDLAVADNDYLVTAMLDALAKNHRIGELAESPSFVNVSGQFQEDCQLDMVAISRSADILALPQKEIEDFTSTPAYAERREQLYQILEEKQIEEAFPALQKFLILTTSSS